MPLRLDNAKSVAHMPTAEAAEEEAFKPRFKVDHAASPMPETRQPERLAPRATSNRNGGRDHLGSLGEIKSEYPGEIIGIRISCPNPPMALHLIPIGRALATKARLLRPGLHVPQRRAIKRLGLRILKLLDVLG